MGVTPQWVDVQLGPRRNHHEGRAALRHYAYQTARPLWHLSLYNFTNGSFYSTTVYPPVVVSLSSCTCGLHYGGFNRNLHFHHRQSPHLTHYTRPWLGRGRVHREGDGWSPVWPQRQGYSRALTSVLTVVTVYTAHLLSPPSCGLIQPIVSNAVHLYTAFSCSSLLTSSEFLLVHEVKWSEVFQLMPNQHQAKLCSN